MHMDITYSRNQLKEGRKEDEIIECVKQFCLNMAPKNTKQHKKTSSEGYIYKFETIQCSWVT